MNKKIKKVAAIIIMFAVPVIADSASTFIGIGTGWYSNPYDTIYYYYPFSHFFNSGYSSVLAPFYPVNDRYMLSKDMSWYGYSGYCYPYPYIYPYAGLIFFNQSIINDPLSKEILDISFPHKSIPNLPGSVPLTLKSEESESIQDFRIKQFLSMNTATNNVEKK